MNIKKYIEPSYDLFKFSLPIVLGNIGHMLISFVDIFVAGRYNTNTLSAISLANAIMMLIFFFGVGFLQSISPITANYRGKGICTNKYFGLNCFYILTIGIIITLISLLLIPAIKYCGFSPDIVKDIEKYILITAFSIIGAFFHGGLKDYLQAKEDIIFANVTVWGGVIFNLILNYTFVFHFNMGIAGLALSTLIVRTLMGIVMFYYCSRFFRFIFFYDHKYIKELLKVGLPISLVLISEVTVFNIYTILAGRISSLYAAANVIIVNLSSITFMIPLAISNAISVKVGFFNGAKDYKQLKIYSISGVVICTIFMSLASLILILFPEYIIQIISSDRAIINICIPLIFIVACFEIFDGIQISLSGILKGVKQTKIIFISLFISYWIIGLPIGLYLGLYKQMYLSGFWISLALSLFTLAIILSYTVLKIFKKFTLDKVN